MAKKCSVRGCGSEARARGWCMVHYARWDRHGDPGTLERSPIGMGGDGDSRKVKFTREHWGIWWERHFGQHPHAGSLKQGIEQLRQDLATRDAST